MCRTPASILPSAALGPLRTWRGLCFASFKRCAGSSVVRPCLSPVGRAPTLCASVASSVLGAPASIMVRSSDLRPFVVNRNICNFLWYGGVEGGAGEGLRSVGVTPIPQPRACALSCPSLAVYRAGELFRGSTPARTSLLKPAADQ